MLGSQNEAEILTLASAGKLPDRIDGSSDVEVTFVRELIVAGFLEGIDLTDLDGPAYTRVRITHAGRQRLLALSTKTSGLAARLSAVLQNAIEATPVLANPPTAVKVFISHRSDDKPLATALVHLLRMALNLGTDEIRCTSVDGHKLSAGAYFSDELRREVVDSAAFIALLTPSSLNSIFTILEIGARWGAGKPIVLLLAGDLFPSQLPSPLNEIHAASVASDSDLHDLVTSVAKALKLTPEKPAGYLAAVAALSSVKVVAKESSKSIRESSTNTPGHLTDDQLMILWQMAKTYVHGAKRFPVSHLGQWTKLNPLKISTSMSGLRAKELVGLIVSADAEDSYFVTDAGLDVMNELHDYSVTDFAKVRDSWRAAHG